MIKDPKRTVQCHDCGKQIVIPYTTYRYCTRTNHPIRCKDCSRKFMSKTTSDNWNKKTPEEKANWGNTVRKTWKRIPQAVKERLSKSRSVSRKRYWEGLSNDEKQATLNKMNTGFRNFWDNLTDEQKEQHAQRSRDQWAAMTPEEQEKKIKLIHDGHSSWFNSLTEDELKAFSEKHSNIAKEQWEAMNEEERYEMIRKVLNSSSRQDNSLHQKFERQFSESHLVNSFTLSPEYITSNNGVNHSWDYAIFDKDNNLRMLVDLDGAYFHADSVDYDGIHSREEYDEKRSLSIPDGVIHCIINELRFSKCFKQMTKILMKDYDTYIDNIFKEMRSQPFPEPHYTDVELVKSWDQLLKMDCTDKYHQSLSLNTRIGDRLIQHFHTSIWMDHRKGELSPYQAWMDDDLLRKCIENRIIYQTHLNPNKILQGFNVSKIAPKVSVFSAGRAKMIISRYLEEFDTIFDPFSGYSGRMLGAISLGKRYIGQDLSLNHVNESNKLMEFLRSKGIQFQAEITQKDIFDSSGEYPCLFTCPPYSDKEQWIDKQHDFTCDDWIDECLRRFKCKRYVFVVDYSKKYKDCVVDLIIRNSHLGHSVERIVIIEGS